MDDCLNELELEELEVWVCGAPCCLGEVALCLDSEEEKEECLLW